MRKPFKYIEPLWLGKDKKISLRSLGAIVLLIDLVINIHNCSYVLIKVLNLIVHNTPVDATIIASLSGYLAQISMILGIEAALIAALLALKTYQPFQSNQSTNLNSAIMQSSADVTNATVN